MGTAAAMVTTLFATASLMPAPSGTSAAQASFALVDGDFGGVSKAQRKAAEAQAREALNGAEDLAAMETASGPLDGGLAYDVPDYDLHAVC